jgi:hypothetical protein
MRWHRQKWKARSRIEDRNDYKNNNDTRINGIQFSTLQMNKSAESFRAHRIDYDLQVIKGIHLNAVSPWTK